MSNEEFLYFISRYSRSNRNPPHSNLFFYPISMVISHPSWSKFFHIQLLHIEKELYFNHQISDLSSVNKDFSKLKNFQLLVQKFSQTKNVVLVYSLLDLNLSKDAIPH